MVVDSSAGFVCASRDLRRSPLCRSAEHYLSLRMYMSFFELKLPGMAFNFGVSHTSTKPFAPFFS